MFSNCNITLTNMTINYSFNYSFFHSFIINQAIIMLKLRTLILIIPNPSNIKIKQPG